jgi:hypothetical protein
MMPGGALRQKNPGCAAVGVNDFAAVASIRAEGWTMRKAESDRKGPGEFVFFAMEMLPDELWLVSLVIGAVFGLIWLLGAVFRSFFGE